MFLEADISVIYWPYIGFAAAKTLQRAFKLTCIPAFAIVTVCCSITSWIATLSASLILSNSSIHTIPLSPKTIAPASKCLSPESGSTTTAAVKPTPDEPLPVVFIQFGDIFNICLKNWDFAVDGSPTINIFISPLRCVPFSKFFSTPPNNCKINAFFIKACP